MPDFQNITVREGRCAPNKLLTVAAGCLIMWSTALSVHYYDTYKFKQSLAARDARDAQKIAENSEEVMKEHPYVSMRDVSRLLQGVFNYSKEPDKDSGVYPGFDPKSVVTRVKR